MAVILKDNVPPPSLPKEVVAVPELGEGIEVIVRGLLLSDRVRLLNSSGIFVSQLLAYTVVDASNQPIYTEHEWEEFGARHFVRSIELFNKAKELSGLDAKLNEKKS